MLKLTEKRANPRAISRPARAYAVAQKRAVHIAIDRTSKLGQKRVQQKMKAVGLGRLSNAVGHTSSARKGRRGERKAWGVIFAKGSDKSLAGGALEAYSRGTTIRPTSQEFLWFQTTAVPRRIGGKRTTPALYNASGLTTTIGRLQFRRIGRNMAQLYIRNVTVSPKSGRAKAPGKGKTRTRIPMKEIVAFVGIKMTRRAKRFDQHQIMRLATQLFPKYMGEELELILSKGANLG